jgi:hypothetical protein
VSPETAVVSERLLTLMRDSNIPEVGVHPNVSFAEYHRWDAASNSRLSVLRRSPAHLKAYMEQPVDTGSLQLGRAVHAAILEPDDFAKRYLLAERCEAMKKTDGKRCSNIGIVYDGASGWYCGVHGGEARQDPRVTILTPPDYKAALAVRDAVHAHKAAKLLPQSGQRELSIVWQDETTEMHCKARLDGWSPAIAGGVIVDVKTTKDASKRAFERSIHSFGYHRQGAFYLEGAKLSGFAAEHFAIIAVEKEPPYAVAIYRLDDGALDVGSVEVFGNLTPDGRVGGLLARYAECVKTDTWPGYDENVQDVALPPWAFSQSEEDQV